MELWSRARREWRYLSGLLRTLLRVESISPNSRRLICDDLEAAVDRWRLRIAFRFEGHSLTYGELDAQANRVAHWALATGLKPGGAVAMLLPNRLHYRWICCGLSKCGVVGALITIQLVGEPLRHWRGAAQRRLGQPAGGVFRQPLLGRCRGRRR